MKNQLSRQQGFTIVEFMIATSVFSVVLLSVSAAVIQMNRSYQRSMTYSKTQAVTSNLVDTVAQAIRFSTGQVTTEEKGPANDTYYSLCVGNRQFLYTLGRRLDESAANPAGGTVTRHAVVTRPRDVCVAEPVRDTSPSNSPKELLAANMRLSNLEVSSTGNMFRIIARVVYGDDDLLCDPDIGSTCTSDTEYLTADQLLHSKKLQCKDNRGAEFCAVSELSSTVYQRL